MTTPTRTIIKTGPGADLAFAVVVLASYFAMFSSLTSATLLDITLMMVLGIAYIAIGIYGYGYCARSDTFRFQAAYFFIQIILGGLIVFLGKGAGFNAMLLLPLAAHGVILLPSPLVYVNSVAIIAAYLVAVFFFSTDVALIWSGLPTFLSGLIFIMVFTQMAVGEVKARKEVERLADELSGANQRLRDYALQIEELSITKERNRMAREIHDGLGHYLTTIHMQIQAARAVMHSKPHQAEDALTSAQNMTQEALADVRRSVAAMRASPVEDRPLPQTIGSLLKDCEGLETEYIVNGEPRILNPQAQWTIYRAAQEGLNNVRKHARASKVLLMLDFSSAHTVTLTVKDDGVGAERTNGGFGLLGLQERVHLVQGEFHIETATGRGFTLEITVPG